MPRGNPAKVVRPKGQRCPGSGRVKGTPNRASVEVRQLIGDLVNSPKYQWKLRRDFDGRKVHPAVESMVWAYHLGKPRQDLNVTASVDVTGRLEEERRVFAQLDIGDLERLAAESQALVDKAMKLAKLSGPDRQTVDTAEPFAPCQSTDTRNTEELLEKSGGSDNKRSVNPVPNPDSNANEPMNTGMNASSEPTSNDPIE